MQVLGAEKQFLHESCSGASREHAQCHPHHA